jgi:hypothetical protein
VTRDELQTVTLAKPPKRRTLTLGRMNILACGVSDSPQSNVAEAAPVPPNRCRPPSFNGMARGVLTGCLVALLAGCVVFC